MDFGKPEIIWTGMRRWFTALAVLVAFGTAADWASEALLTEGQPRANAGPASPRPTGDQFSLLQS